MLILKTETKTDTAKLNFPNGKSLLEERRTPQRKTHMQIYILFAEQPWFSYILYKEENSVQFKTTNLERI